MNKTELIAELAKRCGTSRKDAEKNLNTALDIISETMCRGEKVQLVGFGGFELKHREAHMGRNPKTREPMEIPAALVPVFKPGKVLKERLEEKEGAD